VGAANRQSPTVVSIVGRQRANRCLCMLHASGRTAAGIATPPCSQPSDRPGLRIAAETMNVRHLGKLVRKAVSAWIDDGAQSMGAALAYYTVFSIAPLLIIVIAVAGLVFDREAVRGEIAAQLDSLIGAEGA